MAEQQGPARARRRRHLTPAEKYQVWLEVVTGQGTQREIANKWGIDRSTVVHYLQGRQAGTRDLSAVEPPACTWMRRTFRALHDEAWMGAVAVPP